MGLGRFLSSGFPLCFFGMISIGGGGMDFFRLAVTPPFLLPFLSLRGETLCGVLCFLREGPMMDDLYLIKYVLNTIIHRRKHG